MRFDSRKMYNHSLMDTTPRVVASGSDGVSLRSDGGLRSARRKAHVLCCGETGAETVALKRHDQQQ